MKRRNFLSGSLGLAGLASNLANSTFQNNALIRRIIPKTGEEIPAVGMGSWLTFDVWGNSSRLSNMRQVLNTFYEMGGRVVDSSPMYGSSQRSISVLAKELNILEDLWISTKVWTNGKESGMNQINEQVEYFSDSLMVNHVHNIRDFKTHYKTLVRAKAEGQLKYVGVTHYLNSYHDDLENLVDAYNLDFVQINFNIANPAAADRLIPYCRDRGVAVIINRPFHAGRLFRMIDGHSLPSWASDMGVHTWASYFLKFILAHDGVTCAIPATTQVAHVRENMESGMGRVPSTRERRQLLEHFRSLV